MTREVSQLRLSGLIWLIHSNEALDTSQGDFVFGTFFVYGTGFFQLYQILKLITPKLILFMLLCPIDTLQSGMSKKH